MELKQFKGKQLLLDTNTLIYQLNGKLDLADELASAAKLFISAITVAELYAGTPKEQLADLADYLAEFEVVNVNTEIAALAGTYKTILTEAGLRDLIIAATAQIYSYTLVTANKRDFAGLLRQKPIFLSLD
jgi:predicted nucleic acid-binding protein